ncbi:tumor necrosis factor ligand superfamily member 4 [Nannospalax galili]|uniref:tumor necrosis factor ligand superfamily member 4 n=1 Tax=Nannospalax galili TaxID=1026970 RepID=UPI0004ED5B90|nr:tumor necrosis factor ligand superfamily member 4 [Nannospalax galili]
MDPVVVGDRPSGGGVMQSNLLVRHNDAVMCNGETELKHSSYTKVKYPPVQSIKVQLTRCEQDRLFFSLPKDEYQTMQVQNNSIIITCDGLYLIYLKSSFFQKVGINLHFRKDQNSVLIPTMNKGQRVGFAMVASLHFKDIVYLNVKASNTSCENLQINGGELILIQLKPGRYCAQ